jgi:hypothetical protein
VEVLLGNPKAVHHVLDAEKGDGATKRTRLRAPRGEENVTRFSIPDDRSIAEAFREITDQQGAWQAHSDGDPSWVASDNEQLAALLGAQFGCDVRPHEDAQAAHARAAGLDGGADAPTEDGGQ